MDINMKNYRIYIAAAVLAAAATGCDDDFARPPMVYPSTPDITPTSNIRDIKTQYWSIVEGTPQEIGLDANGDSIIIKGRICSSDETGNIYKNIIVQTVDADGEQWALTFAVNKTKMYETYKYGQEIYINLTGMAIGGYRGLMQLGRVGDQGMSFMDEAVFTSHATPSGLPRLADVDTTATTLANLETVKADNNSRMMWQSRLVRVENVQFEEPGAPFAGSANTNRYIKDAEGHRMIVRNSAYASFKNERIPGGTGNVTGILSFFGNDWQILLIDEAGCSDFTGGTPDNPDNPDNPDTPTGVASISQNFDGGTEIPEGWTNLKVTGDKDWYVREFNGNNYASMSGYKGTAPFDAWLISPAVNMAEAKEKVVSFTTQVNGYGSTTTKFEVYVLSSNDPATATKTALEPALPTAPASGYSSWVNSGELSLAAFTGTIYIGFRYTATTDANYATWCVDNVNIGTKGADNPDTPDTPDTPTGSTVFSESFGESLGAFTIENVSLPAELEYVWSWGGANYGAKASAYKNNTSYPSESWLISPEIDLTAAKGATLVFDHVMNKFPDLPFAKANCTLWARVAGGEWTSVEIPNVSDNASWTFVSSGDISLDAFAGKKVQLGFKYVSAAGKSGTWEVKNLKITAK